MSGFKKVAHWFASLQNKHPTAYFIGDLILNIVVIVALVYGVRTYIISPFQVYGPSMCNTLNQINNRCQDGYGEYLIVNKAVYKNFFGYQAGAPERGDIIVFRPPENEKEFYIKRIIGVPGEKVRIQNGKVYVFNKEHPEGWQLPEEYLSSENKNQTIPFPQNAIANYEVPANMYFVLGDNRKKSTDSRHCFKGFNLRDCQDMRNHFLEASRIEGKAAVVLWPFNKMRILENSAYAGN